MIKIDVTAEVNQPSAPNRPREQVAYAHLFSKDGKANPHPDRVLLPLWRDEPAYAPGTYTLAPQSFYPDKWRSLSLAPKLVPVATR